MIKKPFLLSLALLAALPLSAVEPGRTLRMIPQSGVSKAFDLVTENKIMVRVQFYAPEVFRILAAPQIDEPLRDRAGQPVKDKEGNVKTFPSADFSDPENDPAKAQILVGVPEDNTGVVFADDRAAGVYTFKTSALTLTVRKANTTFSLTAADGTPLWEEAEPLSLDAERGTTQTLKTCPDEFFYGGGQQNGRFSHKGRKIEIRADCDWGEGGHPNPAPWYMTNTGYGVLRHTFSEGVYDFSQEESIRTTHSENRFDAFYFVGGSFGGTLKLYTKFTGRPNFLPLWGLQLGDADAYVTRDKETREPEQNEDGSYKEITPVDAVKVARAYREHDMPCGWLLVNDGYGCNHLQLGYTAQALAALGFRTGLWTEGALDRIKWEVGSAGSRVQKIDVAWSGPAYQHGLECNKIAAEGIEQNSDARAFVWTVQGWAGTQRYGICWTGDQSGSWDLIRYHIPTLTGSSMSGQAYATTDVDGIFGGSNETFLRDLQWKCWTTALYVMNGWSQMNKSPWSYPEPYRSLCREALLRKNRLVPYTYAYMRESWETGAPIVRPLVYNFPEDRATWGDATQYEFMLGDDVLVAPVYTAMKLNKGWRKDVYLPAAQWIDYNDGRRVQGPVTIPAYPIDLSKLPVFVRAGAILPMYPEMTVLGDKPFDPLTFDIYPDLSGQPSSFTLYEDDGETRAFRDGAFARQRITVTAENGERSGGLRIDLAAAEGVYDGMPEARAYEFIVHIQARPQAVTFLQPDGTAGEEVLPLAGENAEAVYANARQGWLYDPEDRYGVLRIKVARTSVREPVSLAVRTAPFSTIAATEPYPVPEISSELDKSDFTVTANSSAPDCPVAQAFDGTDETFWHSYWQDDAQQPNRYPYTLDIALNGLYALRGVTYLPRPNVGNGTVKGYTVQTARHPGHFTTVAEGEFEPFAAAETRTIAFPTVWARYVRVIFTSSQNGKEYASAAEIDILQDLDAEPLAEERKPIGEETVNVEGSDWPSSRRDTVGADWTLAIDGTWDKIKGHAGMATGNTNAGDVTFRLFAQGPDTEETEIFSRVGMKPGDVKQLIDVDLPPGTTLLRFRLSGEANASAEDTGVWTDLHLVRTGSGAR